MEEGFQSNNTIETRSLFYGENSCHSPLHKPSWNTLSRQHFNAETNTKISLKRKQWCGRETVRILANTFFHPPQAWVFLEGHRFAGQITFLKSSEMEEGRPSTWRGVFLVWYLGLRSQTTWKSQKVEMSVKMGSCHSENIFRKHFQLFLLRLFYTIFWFYK